MAKSIVLLGGIPFEIEVGLDQENNPRIISSRSLWGKSIESIMLSALIHATGGREWFGRSPIHNSLYLTGKVMYEGEAAAFQSFSHFSADGTLKHIVGGFAVEAIIQGNLWIFAQGKAWKRAQKASKFEECLDALEARQALNHWIQWLNEWQAARQV